MVNKFEAGKWYIDSKFGDCPFYVKNVDGSRITLESYDSFERKIKTISIEPDKIREGYCRQYVEVSEEGLKKLVEDCLAKLEFFRRK